jgi:serine/threonine protein kinase
MAPESMTQQMYSSMSDVWSFGVFMWEVFADAAQPYEPLTPTEVAIQVCRENLRLQRPKNAMPGAFELMQQCWAERPRDRITFDALYAALSKLAQGESCERRLYLMFTQAMLCVGAKKYDNYWIPNT